MLGKLLPVIFLVLGTGGGIGAGIFLMPPAQDHSENGSDMDGHGEMDESHGEVMLDEDGHEIDPMASEFIEMSNQFVIPVVKKDAISSLVVISLSLETRLGVGETIYAKEPKLRDAFLRVLFDHANMGGFHGAFTNADTLDLLRDALREVAQKEVGDDIRDVLIVDILRQDA